MTLSEIAREVGVCKATVSLVLNGKAKQHHISDSMIRTVEDYCRTIKYRPNIHAVRMTRKIVGSIMFLLNTGDGYSRTNSFSDYNVAQITGGIAHAAREADVSLLVRVFKSDMDVETIFNSFRNHEIDGMIYYGQTIPDEWIRIFQNEHSKVVGIGIRPQDGVSTININNREISKALTEVLIGRGCRSFLYFSGPESSYPGPERYAGFLDALADHRIPWTGRNRFEGEFDEITAHRLMCKYLDGKNPVPDAVMCANDGMAIGVLQALRKYGIAVPARTAVAGGDNIMTADYLTPSLTTFDNLAEKMGIEAFRLLNRQIGGKAKVRNIVLPSKIIRRESA